jgi:hypothetical protein
MVIRKYFSFLGFCFVDDRPTVNDQSWFDASLRRTGGSGKDEWREFSQIRSEMDGATEMMEIAV